MRIQGHYWYIFEIFREISPFVFSQLWFFIILPENLILQISKFRGSLIWDNFHSNMTSSKSKLVLRVWFLYFCETFSPCQKYNSIHKFILNFFPGKENSKFNLRFYHFEIGALKIWSTLTQMFTDLWPIKSMMNFHSIWSNIILFCFCQDFLVVLLFYPIISVSISENYSKVFLSERFNFKRNNDDFDWFNWKNMFPKIEKLWRLFLMIIQFCIIYDISICFILFFYFNLKMKNYLIHN
jgi:hypothetical protein